MIKRYEDFILEINRQNIQVITGLTDEQYLEACQLCAGILSEELGIPTEDIFNDIYNSSDKNLSSIAIDSTNNNLLGAMICKESSLNDIINSYEEPTVTPLSDVKVDENEKAIEGTALSVKEEYRNTFVVFKLLTKIVELGYKYVYIQQFESLQSNINYLRKGCKELIRIESPEFEEGVKVYVYQSI